jgi:hypothetical protein
MKTFWIVLGVGVGLLILSTLWSFLGSAASQRSDFGIISGSLLVIILAAAAVPVGMKVVHKLQGRSKPQEKS